MTFGSILTAPARGLKRLTHMVFRRNPIRMFLLPNSRFDYQSKVGDGTGSSTVMAPLLWIARTFPEAPPMMWRQLENGQEESEPNHPLLRLLQRPNPFYTGPIMWMATVVDWNVDGNAYWLKVRDAGGRLRELWWAPHWTVEPKGDADTFITHYEYRPGDETVRLAPEDVVHFRFGMDGDDPRKGYSPLKSVLREVFTDDEAATFTASLLRNMGVPGLMMSPESGAPPPSPDDVELTRQYMKAQFGGDNRGEALVMSGATKVQQFGFSPEQMLLKELRRIPEERVTAVLGVPAMVAGLGAGLDRSSFTNMNEAREMAYESNVIPSQRIIAEDMRFSLLPDYGEEPWSWRVGFDLSKVRVLRDDEDKRLRSLDVGIRGGWVRVSEGRRAIGVTVEAADEIFLRPMNYVEVPVDGSPPRPLNPKARRNKALLPARAALGEATTEL